MIEAVTFALTFGVLVLVAALIELATRGRRPPTWRDAQPPGPPRPNVVRVWRTDPIDAWRPSDPLDDVDETTGKYRRLTGDRLDAIGGERGIYRGDDDDRSYASRLGG